MKPWQNIYLEFKWYIREGKLRERICPGWKNDWRDYVLDDKNDGREYVRDGICLYPAKSNHFNWSFFMNTAPGRKSPQSYM